MPQGHKRKKLTIEEQNYRCVEALLYNYHAIKRELAWLQDDIRGIGAVKYSLEPTGTDVGDPTFQRVAKLETLAILESARRIEAVEYVLERLGESEFRLVQLWYWKLERDVEYIARECHISKRTCYDYRTKIVREIARRLGWPV